MRLRLQADYALRTLMCLAANTHRRVMIAEVAAKLSVSQNHIVKVVHKLATHGFVDSLRGRSGGIRLAGPADTINLGSVLRLMEADAPLVDCFPGGAGQCSLIPHCLLKGILAEAQEAFFQSVDGYTLAHLVGGDGKLGASLALGDAA